MNNSQLVVAAITPKIRVADVAYNCSAISSCVRDCVENTGAQLIVLPELAITGATCADLFKHRQLIDVAEQAIAKLADDFADLDAVVVLGAPVEHESKLYDCAIALFGGKIDIFPSKSPFDEHFEPAGIMTESLKYAGEFVPFQNFNPLAYEELGGAKLSLTIGPNYRLATRGDIYVQLSAQTAQAGQTARIREAYRHASERADTTIILAGAGPSESTTDFVYSGERLIASRGVLTAAEEKFSEGYTVATVDVGPSANNKVPKPNLKSKGYDRLNPYPFMPREKRAQDEYFEEVLTIQARGLARRLEHTNSSRALLGVSGGLDSTLALLVTARAFDYLALERAGILAVTMPGFGTTSRTKSNAELLSEALGCDFRTIDITASVTQHLSDLGHDLEARDTVFENAQARERTQILMDLSNKEGGLVVGTGDMSELALGWATYNGDHMSMYGVNAGVPKTLVRRLVDYEARRLGSPVQEILADVLDTPVSPELLPAEKDGSIAQKTEDLVGPYELHDFFLWWTLQEGMRPKELLDLTYQVWGKRYSKETILKWLRVFYRRFFSQQFKRSCSPDGPAVCDLSLSPRAGLAMPSDASSALWLAELD